MFKIPDMNGLLQLTLLDEIALQSQIAIRAFERLNLAIENYDNIEIWGAIQSILVSSGNISKILWPSKKYRLRGKQLREHLQIEDNNILGSRVFRNHFEHFDERVEEKFNDSPSGLYIDRQMNPSLNHIFDDRDPICQRGYNTFDHTLFFNGDVLDIKQVIKSIEEIIEYFKAHKLTLFWQ